MEPLRRGVQGGVRNVEEGAKDPLRAFYSASVFRWMSCLLSVSVGQAAWPLTILQSRAFPVIVFQ